MSVSTQRNPLCSLSGQMLGNASTHALFGSDVRTFLHDRMMEGPTYHFAPGIGHHAEELKRIVRVPGIEAVVVADGSGD